MKRRIPRTPSFPSPASQPPGAVTPTSLTGHASDEMQERLIHELDIEIILDDLL